MAGPDRARVLASYAEGVAALEGVAQGLTAAAWSQRCCGEWTATDLAGHVLVVAGWYHQWLDRALRGEVSAPFVSADLPARNAAALAQLDADDAQRRAGPDPTARVAGSAPHGRDRMTRVAGSAPDGPNRMARFAESARSYAERAAPHWDLPYGFPYGRVTAGIHLGAAAAEWHLHAWDLSPFSPVRHVPSDPALVYELLGTALSAGRTSLLPARISVGLSRRAARRAARRVPDPWAALLRRSGRL